MMESAKYQLPQETSTYNFTIAGHVKNKGILKHENGNLLKPLTKDDVRATRELDFYKNVFGHAQYDPVLHDLKKFLPSFNGTWETTVSGSDIKYLCIEDICGHFQNPSVLDIKVGAITYDPVATEAKIKYEIEKHTHAAVIGFRILGMKVYDCSKQMYIISKGKDFGKKLMPEDIQTALDLYFKNNLGQINCLILAGVIHKLLLLKHWFLRQRRYAFYSSSILFAYEGNRSSWTTWLDEHNLHIANVGTCKQKNENSTKYVLLHNSNCNPIFPVKELAKSSEQNIICSNCKLNEDICKILQKDCTFFRVAMIDFAHVFPSEEEDSNYIFGLNNLIANFNLLLTTFLQIYLG